MSKDPELIYYGGSFDPPHSGHRQCVETVVRTFPGAKVVVGPAAAPAGTHGNHKRPQADFESRIEMTKLCFSGLKEVSVSRIEEDLPQPNYTLNTLEKLKPQQKLGLLIGADLLDDFEHWHQFDRVLELAELIVIKRAGSHRPISLAVPVRWLEAEICPAQSNLIRAQLKDNQPIADGWLPKLVLDYIKTNSLYK